MSPRRNSNRPKDAAKPSAAPAGNNDGAHATGRKPSASRQSDPPKRRQRKSKAPPSAGSEYPPPGSEHPPTAPTEKRPSARAAASPPSIASSTPPSPEPELDEAQSAALDDFVPDELGIGTRVVPVGAELRDLASDLVEVPDEPVHTSRSSTVPGDVEAQIRALEARLDGMIRRASTLSDEEPPPPSIREQVGSAAREVVERLASPLPLERPGGDDSGMVDAARELFASKYYLRQWGRIGMRSRSEEVDEFGLDPAYEQRFLPLFDFLYRRYFRIEAHGIEHVPNQGRCIVVANHSGTLPIDGLMLRAALRIDHPAGRELRWLAEDFIFYLPFVGAFMNRIGAVRACPENAERLLRKDAVVAVFPEGLQGIRKLYKDRYQLQRFGRGGFIRLCLRTQTPLVPCAVIGAEEASPMLYRIEYLSKVLGLPYVPVTPTFPALGPMGLLPAPSKWRVHFGEPIHFDGYGPGAADDHVLVGKLSERVRKAIQGMLDEGVRQRKSVWFG